LTLIRGGGVGGGVAPRQPNLCGTFLSHFSDTERLALAQKVSSSFGEKSFKKLQAFITQFLYYPIYLHFYTDVHNCLHIIKRFENYKNVIYK